MYISTKYSCMKMSKSNFASQGGESCVIVEYLRCFLAIFSEVVARSCCLSKVIVLLNAILYPLDDWYI